MKTAIALTGLMASSVSAFGGVATATNQANPPPYEVYNIAFENASPDTAVLRALAEERRSETAAMAGVADSRSKTQKTLDALAGIDLLHQQRASFLRAQGGAASDFPVLEVSLANPTNPYPSVSGKIAQLESLREQKEATLLTKLTMAYNAILSGAKAQLASSLGRASFLRLNPVEPSIEFNMVPSHADTSAAAAALDSMESKRAAAEEAMLNGAISELSEFAKVVVSEISRNAKSRGSFLKSRAIPSTAEGYHRQLNVRLVPSDSFASVSRMAAGMERRRDASEAAIRAAVLDLEMQMAKSLNAFAGAAM